MTRPRVTPPPEDVSEESQRKVMEAYGRLGTNRKKEILLAMTTFRRSRKISYLTGRHAEDFCDAGRRIHDWEFSGLDNREARALLAEIQDWRQRMKAKGKQVP